MGTSEAAKSTVPAWKSEMPSPLPTPGVVDLQALVARL